MCMDVGGLMWMCSSGACPASIVLHHLTQSSPYPAVSPDSGTSRGHSVTRIAETLRCLFVSVEHTGLTRRTSVTVHRSR
jgi:hypothetical protein